MPGTRKRSERDESDPVECPICFEPFEASGPRTKVRPFLCEDGIAHAVCSACDKTLYRRHDDRCPICRAGRSGSSIARNGARPTPMSLPDPMHTTGFPSSSAGGRLSVPDFLSWLPRRVGGHEVPGRRFTVVAADHPAASAAGGYGGRAFYPDESELSDATPRGVSSFLHGFRAASAARRSRSNMVMLNNPVSGVSILSEPIDLTASDDEAVPAASVPDTSADAALAAIMSDEGIGAALDGLRNLPGMSAHEFARRVGSVAPGDRRPVVAPQAR